MVNPIKRLTDKELGDAIKRVTHRNPVYANILEIIQQDGPEDVELLVTIAKETDRRRSMEKIPADYIDLCTRYRSLESYTTTNLTTHRQANEDE